MKRFPDEINLINGGVQTIYRFQNGYGASVVKHDFSYGHEDGLWELAVLDSDGDIAYDTEITDDVVGYLTNDDVDEILTQIENLEAKS